MRVEGSNGPMMRKPSTAPVADRAPGPRSEGVPTFGDAYVSSRPAQEPEDHAAKYLKALDKRQKEEEKARWRRMMLFLLAGFKPTVSGGEVGIDMVDARNKEVKAGAR